MNKIVVTSLTLIALVFAGLVASTADTRADTRADACADTPVDAIYSVPMVTPGLEASAAFPTRSDQNAYGSPEVAGLFRFSLPVELTGLNTDFELKRQADLTWLGAGTDGSKVQGACGRGTVGEERRWFSCTVKFDGLKFDAISRESTLEKVFGRGFEFGQRFEVARFFEGQPIGVIKVRIRCD